MEIITDQYGNEFVFIVNADGSTTSMAKSVYDTLAANSAPTAQ